MIRLLVRSLGSTVLRSTYSDASACMWLAENAIFKEFTKHLPSTRLFFCFVLFFSKTSFVQKIPPGFGLLDNCNLLWSLWRQSFMGVACSLCGRLPSLSTHSLWWTAGIMGTNAADRIVGGNRAVLCNYVFSEFSAMQWQAVMDGAKKHTFFSVLCGRTVPYNAWCFKTYLKRSELDSLNNVCILDLLFSHRLVCVFVCACLISSMDS